MDRYDLLGLAVFVGAVVLVIALVVGQAMYSAAHHCHGDGHYSWTTVCSSTGKSVSCYPIQLEDQVCDK